jgi:hypothetical protein
MEKNGKRSRSIFPGAIQERQSNDGFLFRCGRLTHAGTLPSRQRIGQFG